MTQIDALNVMNIAVRLKMSKVQMSMSIDPEVAEQSKERFRGHISEICELALRKELGQNINESEDDRKCYNCGLPNVNMVWDGLHECWVCPKCNKYQIKSVSIMARR